MPVSAKYTIYLRHHIYASEPKKRKGADWVFGAHTVANSAKVINVYRNVCLGHPIFIQRWKVRSLWPQDCSS